MKTALIPFVENLDLNKTDFHNTCSIIMDQQYKQSNIEHEYEYERIYDMFDLSRISIVSY